MNCLIGLPLLIESGLYDQHRLVQYAATAVAFRCFHWQPRCSTRSWLSLVGFRRISDNALLDKRWISAGR